jgi:AcrR family transcriptional regulator
VSSPAEPPGGRQVRHRASRQPDREAGRQGARQADRPDEREAGRQGGRQADQPAGREAGRQGGRQAARKTGRRAGDSGTRAAILEAARSQFGEHGYDRATIRAIAAKARVDPALVHYFYGSKEALFAAAMDLPFVPSEMITAALKASLREEHQSAGEHLVRSALAVWDSPRAGAPFQGMLRSALTSTRAAVMLREFMTEAILGPLAGAAAADSDDTALRASLIASQMLGLALARYLLQIGPIAAARPDELAAAIGPTIDNYLTGRLTTGDLRPSQ